MKIGGFQRFTLVDYPGKIAAVVFTIGCNFRCPYCHNPELVENSQFPQKIEQTEIFDFLKTRIGKLDAVTITGGEPTLHKNLPAFIKKIKEMGFLVKLDTNGTNPEMLKKLINKNLVDYIAMDLKAPFKKYHTVTLSNSFNKNDIKKSVNIIKQSNIRFEFRTTFMEQIISENDLYQIPRDFGPLINYNVQKFNPTQTLNTDFQKLPETSETILLNIEKTFKHKCQNFSIR